MKIILAPTTTLESTSTSTTELTTTIEPTSTSLTTTEPLTTTSTLESTTALTTSEVPTSSQPPTTEALTTPIDLQPAALQPCYFKADQKLKTDLMETCKPNKKCRVNEFMLDEFVKGERLCCCSLQKDLPPPSEFDPKLEAPKCYFDPDGNVIPFSTLTTGADLICPTTSQMLNYTDENKPTSCCILKDQTTIEPKVM